MRYRGLFDALFDVALRGFGYGTGANLETGGERLVIEYVKRQSSASPVIFDVGVNVGAWTRMVVIAREGAPPPTIHAFENDQRRGLVMRRQADEVGCGDRRVRVCAVATEGDAVP
jgi:hypothetical protein